MTIIKMIFTPIINFFLNYPTPGSLSYVWNFGICSFFFLMVQIVSGLFLSMHYVPSESLAFDSVEEIMRDISYGWLFRYMHSNGASFFFISVYAHVFRNIYYLSFLRPRQWVWYTGVTILILMIVTAFTGYVLPWGQMSYWAATVITNLFSTIPYCGGDVVVWLWGDYGVTTSTLNRFYTVHFILPFVIFILSCLHVFVLHKKGSTSKLALTLEGGKLMFHPFFTFKDLVFLMIVIIIFLAVIGYAPNYLGHPDNYIPADPLVTPGHIVPEWYFLPFYAMLRCVPNKSLGVLVLVCSLLQLFLLPSLYPNGNVLNAKIITQETTFDKNRYNFHVRRKDDETARIIFFGFRSYIILFWLFFINCVFLGILGSLPLDSPYVNVGLLCTIFYFLFFYIGSFIFSERGNRLIAFILNSELRVGNPIGKIKKGCVTLYETYTRKIEFTRNRCAIIFNRQYFLGIKAALTTRFENKLSYQKARLSKILEKYSQADLYIHYSKKWSNLQKNLKKISNFMGSTVEEEDLKKKK